MGRNLAWQNLAQQNYAMVFSRTVAIFLGVILSAPGRHTSVSQFAVQVSNKGRVQGEQLACQRLLKLLHSVSGSLWSLTFCLKELQGSTSLCSPGHCSAVLVLVVCLVGVGGVEVVAVDVHGDEGWVGRYVEGPTAMLKGWAVGG